MNFQVEIQDTHLGRETDGQRPREHGSGRRLREQGQLSPVRIQVGNFEFKLKFPGNSQHSRGKVQRTPTFVKTLRITCLKIVIKNH